MSGSRGRALPVSSAAHFDVYRGSTATTASPARSAHRDQASLEASRGHAGDHPAKSSSAASTPAEFLPLGLETEIFDSDGARARRLRLPDDLRYRVPNLSVPTCGGARIVDEKPVGCSNGVAVAVYGPSRKVIHIVVDGVDPVRGQRDAGSHRHGEGGGDVASVTFKADAVSDRTVLLHLVQPLRASVVKGHGGRQLVAAALIARITPLLGERGRKLDEDGAIGRHADGLVAELLA
jgi:hypothetical protein